ncbi:transcriptional regulator [Ligilactobacillus agilis]|uniref:Transcriptional regulator n=1 Tax=Ligilactobacillus agilis TaxID=1601 RepID=A0A231QW58_9LACO|nr:helix-turn-helix transcriptional regulator [Ligilactobacillus agilis]OXC06755.1 transcriptional regulator [Ligilactobacillus agilis]OXC08523.1 transcriptional regulator [Ligilactobacillus agilis]OXC11495.1 transcriptional regulator [Ligilactobacillus agilis]OXS41560.1 transcriptional regulator [Ligilactobacillus agilis]OXS42740.1 transcriptional regulator [Ligilactobacillus agilis]
MNTFEIIKKLASKRNKSLQQVAEDLNFSKNLFYRWKTSDPKAKDLEKVADYFHVSIDYLMGRTDDKASLSPREFEDIGQMADRMINGLESENSVNFYGEPMSDEDKASLKTALLVALEMNKKRSKQKD